MRLHDLRSEIGQFEEVEAAQWMENKKLMDRNKKSQVLCQSSVLLMME